MSRIAQFFLSIFALSTQNLEVSCLNIRKNLPSFRSIAKVTISSVAISFTLFGGPYDLLIPAVNARNIPLSNGATGTQRGTTAALAPIIRIQNDLLRIKSNLPNNLATAQQIVQRLASSEKDFKRIFDEFSEDISYKQQYLDKNAFVVYYTKGFDGPNRPSIETETNEEKKQKLQFGYRNDAWVAIDDLYAEMNYLLEEIAQGRNPDKKDMINYIDKAIDAVNGYVQLASPEQVEQAKKLVN